MCVCACVRESSGDELSFRRDGGLICNIFVTLTCYVFHISVCERGIIYTLIYSFATFCCVHISFTEILQHLMPNTASDTLLHVAILVIFLC